jgi:hypothetical protein
MPRRCPPTVAVPAAFGGASCAAAASILGKARQAAKGGAGGAPEPLQHIEAAGLALVALWRLYAFGGVAARGS